MNRFFIAVVLFAFGCGGSGETHVQDYLQTQVVGDKVFVTVKVPKFYQAQLTVNDCLYPVDLYFLQFEDYVAGWPVDCYLITFDANELGFGEHTFTVVLTKLFHPFATFTEVEVVEINEIINEDPDNDDDNSDNGNDDDEDNDDNDRENQDFQTICHLTSSGREITLVLPKVAAEHHLENHGDYEGACEGDNN